MKPSKNNWYDRIDSIEKIYNLNVAILDASKQSVDSDEIAQELKNTILDGVRSATESICDVFPENSTYQQLETEIINQIDCSNLVPTVEQWIESFLLELSKNLMKAVDEAEEFPKQVAKKLLSLVQSVLPLEERSKSVFLIKIAKHCQSSAPELSFHAVMNAFLITDDLFDGQYIYDPKAHLQTEFEQCPICGNVGTPHVNGISFESRQFQEEFMPSKLWLKCKKCHNLYSKYYPSELLSQQNAPSLISPELGLYLFMETPVSLPVWNTVLEDITSMNPPGNDLLQVGVHDGTFAKTAMEGQYDITIFEPLSDKAQTMSTLLDHGILSGDFLQLATEQKYSIITMYDILDHFQNPEQILEQAYNLLKEDGILWLSTPNYESEYYKTHKPDNLTWSRPFAITYFSRSGLYPIVKKAGFKIVRYTNSENDPGYMELILQKEKI